MNRTASEPDIERIAARMALAMHDQVAYRGGRWSLVADGRVVPSGVIIAAVSRSLPPEIQGDRRERMAGVIVAGATFRAALRASNRGAF
jgi:hypothetical protein